MAEVKTQKGKKVSMPEKQDMKGSKGKTPSVGGKDVLKAYGIGKGSKPVAAATPKKGDKWRNDQAKKKK
jgi:hypothetical protein